MENKKRAEDAAEWRALFFKLSEADRAEMRALLLARRYSHPRRWEFLIAPKMPLIIGEGEEMK